MRELQQILQSGSIVFFGGAGVSTESGIPDFRSAEGVFSRETDTHLTPEYLVSHDCLENYPDVFFDFYRTQLLHPDAEPNAAHRVLADWERRGRLRCVITQNIDGLHHRAGSETVEELHGSIHRNYCVGCGLTYSQEWVLQTAAVPLCDGCGQMVRPDVVLYGEPLDADVVRRAEEALRGADIVIVGGTSLNVYPAAGLIDLYCGDRLVIINRSPTPYDSRADLVITGNIGDVLSQVPTIPENR